MGPLARVDECLEIRCVIARDVSAEHQHKGVVDGRSLNAKRHVGNRPDQGMATRAPVQISEIRNEMR